MKFIWCWLKSETSGCEGNVAILLVILVLETLWIVALMSKAGI